MQKCNRKASDFFALPVEVTSGGLEDPNNKDPVANQQALKVKESMWAEEKRDVAKVKSTRDWGCEDAREECVEDAETITAWGVVDCDVALDAAVVGI